MRRIPALLVTGGLLLVAVPLVAQDSGSVPMGRAGFQWQTEQRIEQEALDALIAKLDRMEREEWMAAALAWITYDFPAEGRLTIDDSYRVAGIDAGKKGEVQPGGADPPTWGIAWGRKAPKDLELTLTDVNSTKVTCELARAEKLRSGYFGIFQHEGLLLCLAREGFEETGPA